MIEIALYFFAEPNLKLVGIFMEKVLPRRKNRVYSRSDDANFYHFCANLILGEERQIAFNSVFTLSLSQEPNVQ